jgi:hypothetical protein
LLIFRSYKFSEASANNTTGIQQNPTLCVAQGGIDSFLSLVIYSSGSRSLEVNRTAANWLVREKFPEDPALPSTVVLLDYARGNKVVHPVLLVAFLSQMSRELGPVPDAPEKTADSPPAQPESQRRDHKCQGMSLLMPSSATKEQLLAAAGPARSVAERHKGPLALCFFAQINRAIKDSIVLGRPGPLSLDCHQCIPYER